MLSGHHLRKFLTKRQFPGMKLQVLQRDAGRTDQSHKSRDNKQNPHSAKAEKINGLCLWWKDNLNSIPLAFSILLNLTSRCYSYPFPLVHWFHFVQIVTNRKYKSETNGLCYRESFYLNKTKGEKLVGMCHLG